MNQVKIVEHTVSKVGNDIVTFEIRLPKQYVAEFNTHKMEIERNSASSRAVPIITVIDKVIQDPAMPFEWCYNAKGMSGGALMPLEDANKADAIWLEARDLMIQCVQKLQAINADKQRANRLLEPWMWTIIVCTMTGSGGIGVPNFFGLRDKTNVQPEFRRVAQEMHELYHASTPKLDTWHLPYVTQEERADFDHFTCGLIASARCGRVTYYKQGQSYTIGNETERAYDFFTNRHFSPLRHACRAGEDEWFGNFYGWKPISKIMSCDLDYISECCEKYVQKKPVGA